MASKFFAVVAGVGPGTGRSVALRFAKAYPVVLLARKPESLSDVLAEIRSQGGVAFGISADTSDEKSVASAFETIKKELPDTKLAAAVYNVGAGRAFKGFLDLKLDDLRTSLEGNA
jgi:NAD(P)-dependent dehydrogenase (short-subunit alcohol dehydrogenase family)